MDLGAYSAMVDRLVKVAEDIVAGYGLSQYFEIKMIPSAKVDRGSQLYGFIKEPYVSLLGDFGIWLLEMPSPFERLKPSYRLDEEESILMAKLHWNGQHLRYGQETREIKLKANSNSVEELSKLPQINSVSIKDFFAIRNEVSLKLNGNREVYLLGENGDGKTLILMGIHLVFCYWKIRPLSSEIAGAAKDILSKLTPNRDESISENSTEKFNENQFLTSQLSGALQTGSGTNSQTFHVPDVRREFLEFPNFFAYGATRTHCDSDKFDKTGFMSLYSNRTELYSPIALLRQADRYEAEHKINALKPEGERKILPKWLSVDTIQKLLSDILEGKVTMETTMNGVRFMEKGVPVDFEQLSEGFRSTMIWVADLLYRLQSAMPLAGDLKLYRGVVMVDEIELHLHPAWQSSLVKKLRDYFPGIQFIFTTHSPAVVQGASEDAIFFRVSRDVNTGSTTVSEPYYKKDMSHMMFNTLMTSPLFGLESARISPNTEDPDTSDSYLQSRIAKVVEQRLNERKAAGESPLTETDLDDLINQVLDTEWGK